MSNILSYRGYTTEIRYDSEENVLWGGVNDNFSFKKFKSKTADGIIKAFHDTVDNIQKGTHTEFIMKSDVIDLVYTAKEKEIDINKFINLLLEEIDKM